MPIRLCARREGDLPHTECYGIEVGGGRDITTGSSTVEGNDSGIVPSHGADTVTTSGATLRGQTRQGIAVRNTGENARIRHSFDGLP